MSMTHARFGWVTWTSPSSHPAIVFPVRGPLRNFYFVNWSFRPLTCSVRYFCALNGTICDKHKEDDKLYQNNRCGQGHALWESCMRSGNSGESRLRGENRVREWIINENWLLNYSGGRELEENSGWIAVGNRKCGSDVGLLSSRVVRCRGENWIIFSLSQASLWN